MIKLFNKLYYFILLLIPNFKAYHYPPSKKEIKRIMSERKAEEFKRNVYNSTD